MSKPKVSAQEYVEIQNLYALYNLMSDEANAEAYASCFTEDGVLRIETVDLTVTGRQALIEFKLKDKANRQGKYRRHWNGSMHLEKVDDRTVHGRAYFHGYNAEPGQLPVFADAGVYDDTIVNVNGEWRFARRRLTLDAFSWKAPASGSGSGR